MNNQKTSEPEEKTKEAVLKITAAETETPAMASTSYTLPVIYAELESPGLELLLHLDIRDAKDLREPLQAELDVEIILAKLRQIGSIKLEIPE